MAIAVDKNSYGIDRFLYYPDHLACVPSWTSQLTPWQNIRRIADLLLREPVFGGLIWSALREPFKAPPKNYPDDESVAEFISRRFSPRIADNLASAMFHGIYAGDIDKLSANSVLGELRRREESQGSIFTLSKKKQREQSRLISTSTSLISHLPSTSIPVEEVIDYVQTTVSQGFRGGMSQLVDALVAALKKSNKVDIVTNADVNGISKISGTHDLMVCNYFVRRCPYAANQHEFQRSILDKASLGFTIESSPPTQLRMWQGYLATRMMDNPFPRSPFKTSKP